jgi:transposase
MSNNSYTKEFKIKAVELLEQSNKSVRQVAKELGVAENNLYNWRKQSAGHEPGFRFASPRLVSNQSKMFT